MADVQIAVIDTIENEVNVAVPGVQGPIGLTGSVAIAQDGTATEPGIRFESDTNTGIYRPGADQLAISTNAVERVEFGTSEVVFNDGGTNYGFRIEGDTNANLLFVDASTDRVGIGTSSPQASLDVAGSVRVRNENGFQWIGESGATDTKLWDAYTDNTSANTLRFRCVNDAFSGSNTWLQVNRTTAEPTAVIFSTGTSEKVRIDSSGRLGIGTSSPDATLTALGSATISSQANVAARIGAGTTSDVLIGSVNGNAPFISSQGAYSLILRTNNTTALTIDSSQQILFSNGGSERARIDSSGRLLVGASSAYTVQGFNRHSYFCPTAGDTSNQIVVSSVSTGFPGLFFTRTRGATPTTFTTVQDNDVLGAVEFFGADGTDYSASGARIECRVDGTPGDNDMPGRLVFLVTADGASSPTEALRISSSRVISVADAGNIAFGTTTGTKIGTATTQKLGFYNATPVVQPTAVADATDAATVITQLNALLTRMRNLGLIAT